MNSTSVEYLVDPYGRFGADIVAEVVTPLSVRCTYYSLSEKKLPQISANGTVYFINSFDQGLVAALNSATKSLLYYEFDGLGYE